MIKTEEDFVTFFHANPTGENPPQWVDNYFNAIENIAYIVYLSNSNRGFYDKFPFLTVMRTITEILNINLPIYKQIIVESSTYKGIEQFFDVISDQTVAIINGEIELNRQDCSNCAAHHECGNYYADGNPVCYGFVIPEDIECEL